MEKGIVQVNSLDCGEGNVVEVFREDSGRPVDNDYWLRKAGSDCRRYLFSGTFANRKMEETAVREHVRRHLTQIA